MFKIKVFAEVTGGGRVANRGYTEQQATLLRQSRPDLNLTQAEAINVVRGNANSRGTARNARGVNAGVTRRVTTMRRARQATTNR